MAYGDLSLDAPLKPNKGLEGGACNRQSCQAEPAEWYNHGSHSWYCHDCRNDIQFDVVNLRNWTYRYLPECGHAMFETRQMMDERKQFEACKELELSTRPPEDRPPPAKPSYQQLTNTTVMSKKQSNSLQRLLKKGKR